jgi:hypothetical protein
MIYKWEAIEMDGGKWWYDVKPIFTKRGGWMPQSMNFKFVEQMPTQRHYYAGWRESLKEINHDTGK